MNNNYKKVCRVEYISEIKLSKNPLNEQNCLGTTESASDIRLTTPLSQSQNELIQNDMNPLCLGVKPALILVIKINCFVHLFC